jgi:hypothetical protein
MLNIRVFEDALTVGITIILILAFIATGIVIFSDVPSVFNQSQKANLVINAAFLATSSILAGTLIASFFHSGIAGLLRRPILIVFFVAATLELLLFVFDKTVISVKGSALDKANYTVHLNDGAIYLGQPNPQSEFGFRSARVEPKEMDGHRILFLGGSYIAGSGTTFDTNYPQALENALNRRQPDRGISVFSAGVRGYGVVEDKLLYEYLTQQGYRFDTVVLNFMLGSDPTNDIPRTIRSTIVGRAQRFHENRFLRYFYPLNSTLFRFMVYLNVTFNQKWGAEDDNAVAQDASCPQSADFAAFSTERARYYYGDGARKRIDLDFTLKEIDALDKEVRKNGSRFVVILLPDPNALVPSNRGRFQGMAMDWDWIRHYISGNAAGKYALFDLSNAFHDRPDLFRCNDTHWNDAGNLHAADVVADYFAVRPEERSSAEAATSRRQ